MCVTEKKPLLRERSWSNYWRISSSEDKEKVIAHLEHLVPGDDEEHCFLRQRAVLMADEMLENALFAAPRDTQGRPLYAKGERRSLSPDEQIEFISLYDGDTLALEVTDTWGSLTPETVRSFLDMNLSENEPVEDRSGRGLYFMWRVMQDFYLSAVPGIETTVGGLLQLQTKNCD